MRQAWLESAAALLLVATATACTMTPQRRQGGATPPQGNIAAERGPTHAGVGGGVASFYPHPPQTDLGAQISAHVGAIDGVVRSAYTQPGKSPAGPAPGIATLVIGNTAYIGIYATNIEMRRTGETPAGRTREADLTDSPGRVNPNPTEAGVGPTNGPFGTADIGTPTFRTGLVEVIRNRVQGQFPQITAVYVTIEPTLVHRLARITGAMQARVPASNNLTEIMAVAKEMSSNVDVSGGGSGPDGR